MSEITQVALPSVEVRAYCETQPIAKLSVLGQDFVYWLRPDTELGLLVDYLPNADITYIDMSRQERELSKIIGCAVDLRTASELETTTRQQVIAEATLVFAKNSRE